jgi:hypothetical protein
VKYRGEGFLRALVMDACSVHQTLWADHERLKDEHAKVLAEFKAFTVARHDEGKPITRGEALGLTIQDYGDKVAVTKAIDDAFALAANKTGQGHYEGYLPDTEEIIARDAEISVLKKRLSAAEFERDRLGALAAKRADEIVEIDRMLDDAGYERPEGDVRAIAPLTKALEDARLWRESREDAADEAKRGDFGRFSKATTRQVRKDLTRANADLSEIRRLVKAQGKESAVEAVRRHFGEFKDDVNKRHNVGSFFKTIREILGIPVQDHGGLAGILKAVKVLKTERDEANLRHRAAAEHVERLTARKGSGAEDALVSTIATILWPTKPRMVELAQRANVIAEIGNLVDYVRRHNGAQAGETVEPVSVLGQRECDPDRIVPPMKSPHDMLTPERGFAYLSYRGIAEAICDVAKAIPGDCSIDEKIYALQRLLRRALVHADGLRELHLEQLERRIDQ